jgi:N6-adenosine-specific RNA methylase IME4
MMSEWPFGELERGKYRAIYADPPWHFEAWISARWNGDKIKPVLTPAKAPDYRTMDLQEMASLPVSDLGARDCVIFCWGIWVSLPECIRLIEAWGFTYKTCAFNWIKANASQLDMFRDSADGQLGLGYWVRQNSEFCLLGTRGKPKRLNADVRQGIIEPRREHSRKPDCVYDRIERLVAGPYLELFARARRPGWDAWGNEVGKFGEVKS